MTDTIGLSDVSSKDTGKGKELKTGNLKRSYNMAECKKGEVYDKKTKSCRAYTDAEKKSINQATAKGAIAGAPWGILAGMKGKPGKGKTKRAGIGAALAGVAGAVISRHSQKKKIKKKAGGK